MGFPFRVIGVVPDTDVSEAPEGFLDNFEDGGSGVLDPLDGVRTLKQTIVYVHMYNQTLPFNTNKAARMKTDIGTFRHIFSERMKERKENFWINIDVYLACLMAVGILVAELVHRELLLALWKKTLVEEFKYKNCYNQNI